MSIRSKIKNSNNPFCVLLRKCHYGILMFNIPLPRFLASSLWTCYHYFIKFYLWFKRLLFVTPIYKGLFYKCGSGFSSGSYLPFVVGKGKIYVGNNVRINGKVDFIFGSILDELPEVHIGNNTTISHNVTFDVSGKLKIGDNCLIAEETIIQDCSGHHIDPEKRSQNTLLTKDNVRNVTIGNNVWIGSNSYVLPGAHIGDNVVISAMTTVRRKIPKNILVYTDVPKLLKIRPINM